jgi:predicted metal-dependent phosphoesterase TrpH
MLAENEAKMESVDRQSIQKLIDRGHEISFEAYEAYEDDPSRGGWKALNFFIDRGICRDVDDFFGHVFTGEMALDMPTFAEPGEAATAIRRAGGVAICAHPGHSARKGGLALLDRLIERGIAGLECYSPYHDRATTDRLIRYCRERDLLITAGSDTHGGFAGRALGQPEAYAHDLNLGPLLAYVIR